jgi:hypothetical protein
MSFEAFFQSGNIAIVIIAIMLTEAVFFALYYRRFPGIVAGLAAGTCLVLALRAALLHQAWTIIALYLFLSFVFHLLEVLQWLRLAKHRPQ